MATDKARNFEPELSPMAQMAIARAHERHAARLLAIAKLRADNAKLHAALMDVWRPVHGEIEAEAKIAALLEEKESQS